MVGLRIESMTATAVARAALSEMLVEVVANGGSVNFMHPLESTVADRFWQASLDAASRGERVVLEQVLMTAMRWSAP